MAGESGRWLFTSWSRQARALSLLAFGLFAVIALTTGNARAAEDWYVGGGAYGGIAYDPWAPPGLEPETESDEDSWGVLDYGFEPLGSQGGILENQSFNSNQPAGAQGFIAKGYYDFAITPRWRLFAGAGLGMGRVSGDPSLRLGPFSPTGSDESGTVLAYQGMLGLSYAPASPFEFFMGYGFFATDTLDLRSESRDLLETDGAAAAHSGLIGFRYNF